MPGKDDESQIKTREGSDIASVGDCPWEQRFEMGHIRAYWVTVKEILFHTSAFFSKLSTNGPYWEPVLFALVTVIVAFFGVELCAMLKDWASADLSSQLFSLRMKVITGKLTLSDVCRGASIVLIGSMFQVVVCHLALTRLCSTYQGFQATWRVYFYAQAAQLAYMVPFIGTAIGPVWYAVVLTVGLAKAHRTRIEIALLGPLVIASTTVFLRITLQLVLFWLSQMRIYDSRLLWSWILGWI